MTTRDLSRTVIAAFAAFADKAPAGGTRLERPPSQAPAAAEAPSAPVIGVVSPDTGSTGGSTPLKISGSGFQSGAAVFIDGIAMSAYVLDSRTIYACTPPHDAGKVDLVVANPDGLSDWCTDAYTYVSPRTFDFNGDWIGVAGSEHQMELRFTIRNDMLANVSCCRRTVAFSAAPAVYDGEFTIVRSDGIGISARIVSATEAVGTINMEPCPYTNWVATRSVKQG